MSHMICEMFKEGQEVKLSVSSDDHPKGGEVKRRYKLVKNQVGRGEAGEVWRSERGGGAD